MNLHLRILLVSVLFVAVRQPVLAQETSGTLNQALQQLVLAQRESTGLVGLGAIVIHDNKVIGPAVSGERKKGSRVPLSATDRWHIGSVTKSFTATMIARLVEKGVLSWATSIQEVFRDVVAIDPAWHDVTLVQLLNHTSGARANFPFLVGFRNPAEGSARSRARESAVMDVLKSAPESVPGDTFTYSNVGYTIAGVMAEKKTGLSWETLIEDEIFTPLQLRSGGFGPPRDVRKRLDQPRGHKQVFGFTIAAGTQDDNTPIIGPAGTIHLSLQDLALFAKEHLDGLQGKGSLLDTKTFRRLHSPSLNNYAYGWFVNSPKDLGAGTVLWHNGSNRRWYTLLALLPRLDAVVAVASNDGDIKVAEKSARDIISQLVNVMTDAE